uniref:uncharacterized protein n=1 Tax=Pristiophorus japonicus TaxID=55135 RepID=UPI00398F8CEB
MEDNNNDVVSQGNEVRAAGSAMSSSPTPSQAGRSTPEEQACLGSARGGGKEPLWNYESAMEERSGNRTGSVGNQTWHCPVSASSESEEYNSDLDSIVSDALDEELTEERDYLRSLLRIIGEPPPFQYYSEFENAMNSPGTESSFSFLQARVCSRKDNYRGAVASVHGQYAALTSDKDKSLTVNSIEEADTSSLGNVSQYRKVKHSGVVAPFSTRTLSHPSFHSFYAAVGSQQSQDFPADMDGSRLKDQASIGSHSKPGCTVKSEASLLRSQEIHMPAIHPCEFFYTDPSLPSGYRVYNHLSLPTRQVLQGLRLNTPAPVMSAFVAPTTVQRENRTAASHSLNRPQEQSSPVSKAEHDAVSTLLELEQCGQLDSTGAQALKCPLKSEYVHQTSEDLQDIGIHLSANSGDSGIMDCADTKQKHFSFLHDWSNTELYKIAHLSKPEYEHSSQQLKSIVATQTSRKSEGGLTSASSEAEVNTFDSTKSSCAGRLPAEVTDIVPEVAQDIEISSCDFLS